MYFFILGSHPSLSAAEIAAVVGFKKDYSLCSNEILLLDQTEESPEALQNQLAGVIKIGDIITEVKKINRDEIANLFVSLLPYSRDRVNFGISVYNLDKYLDLSSEVKQIGMTIKTRLKEDGRSARFVTTKTPALSSAAVVGEKLLEQGAEFVLVTSKDKIYLGQTRTVQDFNSWSERDYGRPARDAKSGMLPPKLARMMINLSGAKTTETISDPFCGSGTILMEAALMGFKNIVGSDISEKAIEDTKTNLAWLDENFGTSTSNVWLPPLPERRGLRPSKPGCVHRSSAEVGDGGRERGGGEGGVAVENLAEILKKKLDVVVAETYLGPPMTGRETPNRRRQIVSELAKRTASGLVGLKKLLKKSGSIVLALPAVRDGQNISYLPTKKLAKAAGFKVVDPLPELLPKFLKEKTPSGGLLYSRKDQKVAREIVVLK